MLLRRESRTGANDLHTVYRPYKVDEVLGHTANMALIKKGLESGNLPHANLFIGDAGCGKTTAARIIALGLNCLKSNAPTSDPCLECESCNAILNYNSIDVIEVNVAQSGNKADVDTIARDLPGAPFMSRYKVIIFDEAHKLSDAAQALLLKVIEDGYKHVYFVFCTNIPEKLKPAFLTRCSTMRFDPLDLDSILKLLVLVAESEYVPVRAGETMEVLKLIARECRGVPRTALMWLSQIKDANLWSIEAASKHLNTIGFLDDPKLINICRAAKDGSFQNALAEFEKLKVNAEADSLRIGILGYFVACLKNAKNSADQKKFSRAIDILLQPVIGKGTLGDYAFYNYLFKVACIMSGRD